MATAAIGATARMPPSNYQSRKTEAMPKASLFGSTLEIHDESASNIDPATVRVPKTPPVRGAGQRLELPPNIKRDMLGASVLEKHRNDLDTQQGVVNQAKSSLRKKEEEALYNFSNSANGLVTSAHARESNKPRKYTEKDLEGAQQINTLGLNKYQSYNRDKYGNRAPVHNYTLIGDLLRPGMDMPRRERTEVQMRNQGYGVGDMKGVLKECSKPPSRVARSAQSPQREPIAPLVVPPNIKHQFGSRICDNLLADKDKVEQTIKDQQQLKASIQRPYKPVDVPKFSKELNPNYEMLGNALRMNVVPGYTTDHKTTTTKSAYNDQVHLFRYRDPEKWRYQKDELSTWSEQQFLHKRLASSWKELLDNAPKFDRNWDPDAVRTKRPKTTIQPTNKRTQRRPARNKTAPNKDKNVKKESDFEDFVFESPPVTPVPEETSGKIEAISQKKEKDSAFWDFYDKS